MNDRHPSGSTNPADSSQDFSYAPYGTHYEPSPYGSGTGASPYEGYPTSGYDNPAAGSYGGGDPLFGSMPGTGQDTSAYATGAYEVHDAYSGYDTQAGYDAPGGGFTYGNTAPVGYDAGSWEQVGQGINGAGIPAQPGPEQSDHGGPAGQPAWETGAFAMSGYGTGTYTTGGFDTGAYDTSGFDTGTYGTGYDGAAYDTGTFDPGMHETGAYDSTGAYATGVFTPGAYDTGAYDTSGFDTGAYTTGGFDTGAYTTGGFDTGAYTTASYDTGSYESAAYDTGSFDTGAVPYAYGDAAPGDGPWQTTGQAWGTGAWETGPWDAAAQTGAWDPHQQPAPDGAFLPADGTGTTSATAATASWDSAALHDQLLHDQLLHEQLVHEQLTHEQPLGEQSLDGTATMPAVPADPDDPADPATREHPATGDGPEHSVAADGPEAAPRSVTVGSSSRGRRRQPKPRRSALLTVAVPSVAVLGVTGVATASVMGSSQDDDSSTEAADASAGEAQPVKPSKANSKLDTQLAGLSADADDFADRASRTQERIDLKKRQAEERKRKAAEAARKEAMRPKFALPVLQRGLSAQFGSAGVNWMSVHTGIDFPVSHGTPVRAATDGTVTTKWDISYGNMAIVTAADGTETWYCHLSSTKIRSGEVKAGHTIGYSGNSGNSTGPHLHFEVRPGGGAAVDPVPWLRSKGLNPT